MSSFFWILVIILLFSKLGKTTGFPFKPVLALEPVTAEVTQGEKFVFLCKSSRKTKIVQWVKETLNFRSIINESRRHTFIKSATGIFKMQFNPVILADEGKYYCATNETNNGEEYENYLIYSRHSTLKVFVAPKPPKIYMNDKLVDSVVHGVIGEEMELTCSSEGGRPPAVVLWKYPREISPENVTNKFLRVGNNFAVNSIIKIKPELQHQNMTLTCYTQNDANFSLNSASVLLNLNDMNNMTDRAAEISILIFFVVCFLVVLTSLIISIRKAVPLIKGLTKTPSPEKSSNIWVSYTRDPEISEIIRGSKSYYHLGTTFLVDADVHSDAM